MARTWDGGWPLKRYSRNLFVALVVTAAASMPVLLWLRDAGFYLLPDDMPDSYVVAISIYNGFAVAGLLAALRFLRREPTFLRRLGAFMFALLVCTVVRIYVAVPGADPLYAAASGLWETARAFCVAFAVAYVAHSMMVRYLPSTFLRVRDITPIVTEGRVEGQPVKRVKHARNSRWIFDMGSREHLDTTKLQLRTRDLETFSWREWGAVAMWAVTGLVALSIYAEVYPRAEERFDVLWNAVITGHLLSIVPILVLPMYPIAGLGPRIAVGDRHFDLSRGFAVQLKRWLKVAFFPIIAVGLFFKAIPWEGTVEALMWDNVAELMQTLLITVPTALITCMVYLECFRRRTVAEVHRGIQEREEVERDLYPPEPWRENPLLEGTEIVDADFYLE
jgi:hypothetical protein